MIDPNEWENYLVFTPDFPEPIKNLGVLVRSTSAFGSWEDFRALLNSHSFFPDEVSQTVFEDAFRAEICRVVADKWDAVSPVKYVSVTFQDHAADANFSYALIRVIVMSVRRKASIFLSLFSVDKKSPAQGRCRCGSIEFREEFSLYRYLYHRFLAVDGEYIVIEGTTPDGLFTGIFRFTASIPRDKNSLQLCKIEEEIKFYSQEVGTILDLNLCREKCVVNEGRKKLLSIRDFSRHNPQPEKILHQKFCEEYRVPKLDNWDYLWLKDDTVVEVWSPDLEPYARMNLGDLPGVSVEKICGTLFSLPPEGSPHSMILCLEISTEGEENKDTRKIYYGLSRR